MKTSVWLIATTKELGRAGIGTPRLDTLVLLEDVMGIDRARLLAEPKRELSPSQHAKLEKLLKRRASHEPLAYIRGHTEFYGREFVVTPAVLEPRPESEAMIDLLKVVLKDARPGRPKGSPLRIADVGAGSGCLGITAALEVPEAHVELFDMDPRALEVAQKNVDKFTLNISVTRSDLLSEARRDYMVLLCNLPYVPDSYSINEAAGFEPKLAIFGGKDGLDLYSRLFGQISKLAEKPLYILTEALSLQHKELDRLAASHGYKLKIADGLIRAFEPY